MNYRTFLFKPQNPNDFKVAEPRLCPSSSQQHQSSVFAELSFTSKTVQDLFPARYCLAVLCSTELNFLGDELCSDDPASLTSSGANLTICTFEFCQKSSWPPKSNKHVNRPLTCCLIFQVIDTWEALLSLSPQQPAAARAPGGEGGPCSAGAAGTSSGAAQQSGVVVEETIPPLKGLSLGILGYSVRKFHGCFWQASPSRNASPLWSAAPKPLTQQSISPLLQYL